MDPPLHASTLPKLSAIAARSVRSLVPDLLFEDVQDERLAELSPFLAYPELVSQSAPLHRITLFATKRCNLACTYCKMIAPGQPGAKDMRFSSSETFTLAHFREFLHSHRGTAIRHLHLTGGEPALVPQLDEMVRMARADGAQRISLTSNGSLPWDHYLRLVRAGIDEIRISIDAPDAIAGRFLTRRHWAWQRAVANVRALAARRDRGAPFFLIVNSVVNTQNRHRLDELLRFLLALGPNDVKLIAAVDEKDILPAFVERESMMARVQQLLASVPAFAYPLLRRKLSTVFTPEAIGLEPIEGMADQPWRCYVPLTERTVDTTHYYPCSVYLREGGQALGQVDEPQELQRSKLAHFVREANCLQDPICRRYCLYCTRQLNVRANTLASASPSRPEIAIQPTAGQLDRFLAEVPRLSARLDTRRFDDGEVTPYLLVTPLALPEQERLTQLLTQQDIQVARRLAVSDWPRLSTVVYLKSFAREKLLRAFVYESLWRSLRPGGHASCWYLASKEDYQRMVQFKQQIRAELPSFRCRACMGELSFLASLHSIHVPDPQDLACELRRLQGFLAETTHASDPMVRVG